MNNCYATGSRLRLVVPVTLLAVGLSALVASAQAQMYKPLPLAVDNQITDRLSDKDIPVGQGGFARDYIVSLAAGDKVTIALSSKSFDTFVLLLAADGSTVGENDDGLDASTNSLLVVQIKKSDNYIVRVQPSRGKKANGAFTLKVTRSPSKS